ncbi:MAG: hydantoinase/oxoprolinase family protein [Halobacteria archaeon]
MLRILGLDIGGANIKLSLVEYEKGAIKAENYSVYFPIWRKRDELPSKLKQIYNKMKIDGEIRAIGVTTTAELSDVYPTKREGIEHVLRSVEKALPFAPIYVLDVKGKLRSIPEAVKDPLKIASVNWVATAYVLSKKLPSCILVDVGSTTTDIIPIVNGNIKAKGKTDLDRLISSELVYTGALRSNVAAIVRRIPIKGSLAGVSSEYFSITGDVNLILGKIKKRDYSCETPDGRGKTVREAMARLARVICADLEMLSREEVKAMARYIYEEQVWLVANSLSKVRKPYKQFPIVITGLGKFIARDAAKKLGVDKIIDLDEIMGLELANAAPAAALAIMLAEKLEAEKCIA